MKKYINITMLLLIILIPINVKAAIFDTTVLGEKQTEVGEVVEYTVTTNTKLTKYDAMLNYDKDNMYLIGVETSNDQLEIIRKGAGLEKLLYVGPETIINYKLKFLIKENCNQKELLFSIVTKSSLHMDNGVEVSISGKNTNQSIEIILKEEEKEEEEVLEEIVDSNISEKIENKSVGKFEKIIDDNYKIIIYVSLGLNLILLISVIVFALKKNVDYGF